jgi:DNA-binding GntR family transcriptional regulator
MVLGSIDHANVAERIAAELRDAIQGGELRSGERLVERALAEKLGVSHIPVREAIARLAEEGLVDRTPRKVARVASLSDRDLEEISSLRIVLECFVGRLVQSHWDPRMERQLRRIAEDMATAARRADTRGIASLDREFHETLWKMADHRELMAVASQLRRRIDGFLTAANEALSVEELEEHALSHMVLLDAIASGIPAIADAAIESHIQAATARIFPAQGVK